MEQQHNRTIIVVLAALIIIGAFFGYRTFWSDSAQLDLSDDAALQAEADKVNPFNQEEPANPFEESANPYENIKTNPYE